MSVDKDDVGSEDRLIAWRLRWTGAVGAFLGLVTVLGWTTVLKLAASGRGGGCACYSPDPRGPVDL